jgi:hypothetical protein
MIETAHNLPMEIIGFFCKYLLFYFIFYQFFHLGALLNYNPPIHSSIGLLNIFTAAYLTKCDGETLILF